MDEIAMLTQRIGRMSACADARDWAQLRLLDEEVAAQLRALAGHGVLSTRQKAALASLRQTHARVLETCRVARDEAAQQLRTFCAQREAHQAYELMQEMENTK